jgi:hypothetical protein
MKSKDQKYQEALDRNIPTAISMYKHNNELDLKDIDINQVSLLVTVKNALRASDYPKILEIIKKYDSKIVFTESALKAIDMSKMKVSNPLYRNADYSVMAETDVLHPVTLGSW